jgi:hypothetical protein
MSSQCTHRLSHENKTIAGSASQQAFSSAVMDFLSICEEDKNELTELLKSVNQGLVALQVCEGCSVKDYTERNKEGDLQIIYRFLRFEQFFYDRYREHIPQKARALGRLLIEKAKPEEDLGGCSLCTETREGSSFTQTYCGHVFHKACLFESMTKDGTWNKSHQAKCPDCSEVILTLHSV